MFNIQHPISLAGMNVAAGPKLAAAVTNAGGIGVIGGVGYTPAMLKEQVLLPILITSCGSFQPSELLWSYPCTRPAPMTPDLFQTGC